MQELPTDPTPPTPLSENGTSTYSPHDATQLWCARHWLPYRTNQGNGVMASILIVDALVHYPAFKAEVGAADGVQVDTAKLNAALERHSPICCYLGDAVMETIRERSQR